MPPMLGGFPIRRALSALISSMSMIVLSLVPLIPAASPSAAVTVVTTNTPTATITARSTAATTLTYSDSARRTTKRKVSVAKVKRGRYQSYLTFPAITLAPGETITSATLTLKVSKTSKAKPRIYVRALQQHWTGRSFGYQSRPAASVKLGQKKVTSKKRSTVTVRLNVAATAPRLARGLSLRLDNSSRRVQLKVSRTTTLKITTSRGRVHTKPAPTPTPTATPTPTPTTSATPTPTPSPTASTTPTPSTPPTTTPSPESTPTVVPTTTKPVFAHYFPPYPISLDNTTPSRDYYATQYLLPSGEGSKFAWCGGLLRDRPLGREPISGDFQLADMHTEVRQAKAAGLSGFAVDLLTTNTADRNWYLAEKLMQAADSEGNFSVMLQPDMWSLGSISTDTFAAAVAKLSHYDSVYTIDGKVVVAPFYAEAKSASWYATALATLQSDYGVSAVLLPVFLDANKMADYQAISVGFANWGVRNPAALATWTNWTAKAHSLNKLWMEPVSVQDVRPNQQIYDEAGNTETLGASWKRAITQGADLVLLPTWNDYSESTSFAPSADHGWAFLNVNQYYLRQFQAGRTTIDTSVPATSDEVIISHRIQKVSTPVSYSATMNLRSGSTAPRDTLEVVTMLTSASTVTVTTKSGTYTYQAPAGYFAKTYPLVEGTFSAAVQRAGSTVAAVTTKDAVSFSTTAQQDLTYHAVTSLNR